MSFEHVVLSVLIPGTILTGSGTLKQQGVSSHDKVTDSWLRLGSKCWVAVGSLLESVGLACDVRCTGRCCVQPSVWREG